MFDYLYSKGLNTGIRFFSTLVLDIIIRTCWIAQYVRIYFQRYAVKSLLVLWFDSNPWVDIERVSVPAVPLVKVNHVL